MRREIQNKMEEYYPKYMTLKLNARIDMCNSIVEKYKRGESLSNSEEMMLLSVLNKTNNIEITQQMRDADSKFLMGNVKSIGFATAGMLMPFLVREFHELRKWKRNTLLISVFAGVYGVMLTPYYLQKKAMNSRLVRDNIHKFQFIQKKQTEPDAKSLKS